MVLLGYTHVVHTSMNVLNCPTIVTTNGELSPVSLNGLDTLYFVCIMQCCTRCRMHDVLFNQGIAVNTTKDLVFIIFIATTK